tara:strand:- start:904 stop:1113 length:210 start_codon:yes stop_codon:yes gene_type:complete
MILVSVILLLWFLYWLGSPSKKDLLNSLVEAEKEKAETMKDMYETLLKENKELKKLIDEDRIEIICGDR